MLGVRQSQVLIYSTKPIDTHIGRHMGETRDDRIAEFCMINPHEIVIALREGSGLQIKDNELDYFSGKNEGFKIFQYNQHFPDQFNTSFAQAYRIPEMA